MSGQALLSKSESVIESYLDADERLYWTGQPKQGFYLRASDAFAIPYSLMVVGMASLMLFAGGAAGNVLMVLFIAPLVVYGLLMLIGRFWVDAAQRRRAFYAVTDRRALIVCGLFSREVKSLAIAHITETSLKQRWDGRGTITFGPPQPWWQSQMKYGYYWPGMDIPWGTPCFEAIEDARSVYDLIRGLQMDAAGGVAGNEVRS